MPRLSNIDPSMENMQIGSGKGFHFSATRIEHLGATEYTLVTIAVDVTGSVDDFADDLLKCLQTAVESCKKSPRSNNLLLRLILFSSSLSGGIEEIHGFKPLGEIDPGAYQPLKTGGMTPLFDAVYSGVGATNAYAKQLMSQNFLANGIVFVLTDGDDNASSSTPRMIRAEIDRGQKGEDIESLVPILIGVNAKLHTKELQRFATEADLKYIDIGDATKGKLAKLAEFVSQSVSSQSQAIGTGGPSQAIAATI
ncbi:MAG: hypothetical protein Q7S84_03190 [bacterium]|nr:hypothetical protein [bacterium]